MASTKKTRENSMFRSTVTPRSRTLCPFSQKNTQSLEPYVRFFFCTRYPLEFLRENGAGMFGHQKIRTLRSKGKLERRPKSRTLCSKGMLGFMRRPCLAGRALSVNSVLEMEEGAPKV